MYFRHFKIREVFNYCTDTEVTKCIREGHFENILTLLSVLDSFREEFDHPIIITSSFRDFYHNKRVGGSPTSQHLIGQALDFKCNSVPFETMVSAFKTFLNCSILRCQIGQVIIYKQKQFIHVALNTAEHPYLIFLDYD